MKQYELTNHLGNVMAVVSDKRVHLDDNGDTLIDRYSPSLAAVTASSAQAQGARLIIKPYVWTRTVPTPKAVPVVVCNDREDYRFGFNGQEKVNEIAGIGNHTTALFWEYDTRIARRWNRDPKKKDWESDYSVLGLNPIINVDPLGDDWYKNKEGAAVYNKDLHGKEGMKKLGLEGEYIDKKMQGQYKDNYGNWMSVSGAEDGQMSASMSEYTVSAKGKDNSMNVLQAAGQQIGRNDENRQRADWMRNAAAGWLGAGFAVPAAVVGGVVAVEAGAIGYMVQGGRWLLGTNRAFNWTAAGADAINQWEQNGLSGINPVSVMANGIFRNPLMQSVPGAFVDLSPRAMRIGNIFSNPRDINVYNNIMCNTRGNMLGDKLQGPGSSGIQRFAAGYFGNKFAGMGEVLTEQR